MKPQQILDLEKHLDLKLTETKIVDDILNKEGRLTYLINDFRYSGEIEVIGINLFDCELSDITFLKKFSRLESINLGRNKISDISIFLLKQFEFITELILYWNKIADISAVNNLRYLSILDLKLNPVSEISVLENLTHLQTLDLFGTNITDISSLKSLENLNNLELSNTYITTIFPLKGLRNLQTLCLEYLSIFRETYILCSLKNLTNLKLQNIISKSQLKKIAKLTSLQYLSISRSGVDSILIFKNLTNLISLEILDSEKPIDISLEQLKYFPNLEHLCLQGCNVNNIPKEVIELKNSLPYFKDGETYGWDENKDLKLVLIGNGGVGKTSLVRRLVENKFDKEYDSTHGIQLEQYTELQPYHINIWDFGGQDIYHATHRLFMKTRALFVLVWDWQTEQEPTQKIKENNRINEYQNHDLDYWLNYVKVLGEGSKVIVVQTKMQRDGEKKHPRENELRAKYQDIWLDTISIESEENNWAKNGFKKLKLAIENAIESGEVLRKEKLPKNWITQRNEFYKLLQLDTKTIDYKYFVNEMCKDNPLSPDTILSWLSDSGVVFYREGLFKNQIILKQEWAIDAVYTLFDRRKHYFRLKDAKGKFTKDDLNDFWGNNTLDEQNLFLNFMLSCEICYCSNYVKGEYIAPAFLPDKKEGESLVDFWEGKTFDTEKYEFAFLHYGVIQSFIVRLHKFRSESISTESVWQYGVLFKDNNLFASVEANLQDKTILVSVSHSEDQSLLNKIQNLIYELDSKENIKVTFFGATNVQRKEDEKDRFVEQVANKMIEKLKPEFSSLEIGQGLLIEETIKNSTTLNRVDETTIRTEQSIGRIEQTLNEMYQEFRGQFQTVITKSDNITNQITDFDQRTTANLAQLDTKFEEIVAYYTDNLLALNQQVISNEIKNLIVTPSKKTKFDGLDNMTKKYLYTAEYAWEAAKKTGVSSSLDFSIAIFAFGKAVENEMFALMEIFKSATANNPPYTRDFRNLIIKGFKASHIQKIIENNDSSGIEGGNNTNGLKHFKTNYVSSVLLPTLKTDFENCFNTFVGTLFEAHFRTDLISPISNPTLDGLMPSHCITRKQLDFIREVRNSAAHPSNHIRTKPEAENYRKLVLDFFGFWCNHLK